MKSLLTIVFSFFLVFGISLSAVAKGNSQSSEMLVERFNVNGRNVEVNISKENRQKVSEKVLRGLAEEFFGGTITVISVGDLVKQDRVHDYKRPNPNYHKIQNEKGEFLTQTFECSYWSGTCNTYSDHFVTSMSKTSYGNRGSSHFLISVARGAEKSFVTEYGKTLISNVSGGVSGIRSEVSASINASVSRKWSKFSGIIPDVVLPNNSREFYWAGLYDYGNWSGYEDNYDKYGLTTRYYHIGTYKEYVRDISWSVDKQY